MKYFLLTILLIATTVAAKAQAGHLSELPSGTYESRVKATQQKWSIGDIVLSNAGKYSVDNGEPGEFRFSVAAQRVFFMSGSLRGMFATTSLINNFPVIIFPANGSQPLPLPGDVWATYRK